MKHLLQNLALYRAFLFFKCFKKSGCRAGTKDSLPDFISMLLKTKVTYPADNPWKYGDPFLFI